MRWLPRFSIGRWTGCFTDGEAEGYVLMVEWGRFDFEISFARHNGRLR